MNLTLQNGKEISGMRFFFVGETPEEVKIVDRKAVVTHDSPLIDPPFGVILLTPPSTVWIELYKEGETLFREIDEWYSVRVGMTRKAVKEILVEELATIGDPDVRWHENAPNLMGATESNRYKRYEKKRRIAGLKTLSIRLDAEALRALERRKETSGKDSSQIIRELLTKP